MHHITQYMQFAHCTLLSHILLHCVPQNIAYTEHYCYIVDYLCKGCLQERYDSRNIKNALGDVAVGWQCNCDACLLVYLYLEKTNDVIGVKA